MSELKEHLFMPYSELQEGDELTDAITIAKSYYLKSEADKVIAEKDKEIAKLKEQVSEERSAKVDYKISADDLSDGLKEAYAEIQRHRYKRCLDKAKWCKDKVDAIQNGYMWSNIESQKGVMTTCPPECNPKFSFYFKWHKRWLKIAEEFKGSV